MTETINPSTPNIRAVAELTHLEDWGSLAEATGDTMTTSGVTLWSEGDVETGIWECTPGASRWLLETNELVYVVKGRMTVTADGGDAIELNAGDTATFPKGWSGTWDIHETLRKVYAIF